MKIRKGRTYPLEDGRTATVLKNYIRKQEVLLGIGEEEVRMPTANFEELIESNQVNEPDGPRQFRLRNGDVATYHEDNDQITYHVPAKHYDDGFTSAERTNSITREQFNELVKARHIELL